LIKGQKFAKTKDGGGALATFIPFSFRIAIVTAFAFVSLFLENESMLDYVFMSAFRAGFWHLA